MFSCEFCEISKSTFFTDRLWKTASEWFNPTIRQSVKNISMSFTCIIQCHLQKFMKLPLLSTWLLQKRLSLTSNFYGIPKQHIFDKPCIQIEISSITVNILGISSQNLAYRIEIPDILPAPAMYQVKRSLYLVSRNFFNLFEIIFYKDPFLK